MRLLAACVVLLSIACSSEAAKQRHFQRGEQHFADGRYADAIIEFRSAVGLDEHWGEARYRLAEAYAANAEPERASREYVRAADLLPDDARAQLKAAAYLLLDDKDEDAKARALRVLARDPGNVEAQVALGNALAGLRDLDQAAATVMDAIALDPARSQSYLTLARIRVAQGRADEARAAFERAVTTDSRSVTALLARANFQWSVGELDAAETTLKRVLDVDGGNIVTRRVLAALYLASGRVADAEQHLQFVADVTHTVDARLSLADYYLMTRRYDEARGILTPLRDEPAARGAADTRLANIAYAQGSTAEARQLLEAVLAAEPNNESAHTLKARWLLDEGQPEQALEHARVAVSARAHVPGLYVKAEAEARTRRSADAIRSLLAILERNPRDADAQTRLSSLHLARNEIDSAVLAAEQALAIAPDSVNARLALARALIARDDFKAAAAELARARDRAPADASVQVVAGVLEMREGDRRAARAAFERALELDSGSREALEGVVSLDVMLGHASAARKRIEPRLASFDRDSELLVLSAKVLLADGAPAAAEAALRRAIALDPLDVDSAALLARVLNQQGTLDSSLAAFDDAATREPGNLAARVMGAIIVHTQGKTDEATRRYQAILQIEPRAVLAANNLAAIYADEGTNLVEAQRLAQSAAEQLPAHAGIHDTLGWVYLQRRLYGPAMMQFRQSIAADSANSVYHYHLGLALVRSGERSRARESFQRAMKLNPRLEVARRALAGLD
jgi:putative PEP-CTERM system TPR-repeat lipoprotein